jgi:hypothetical protein
MVLKDEHRGVHPIYGYGSLGITLTFGFISWGLGVVRAEGFFCTVVSWVYVGTPLVCGLSNYMLYFGMFLVGMVIGGIFSIPAKYLFRTLRTKRELEITPWRGFILVLGDAVFIGIGMVGAIFFVQDFLIGLPLLSVGIIVDEAFISSWYFINGYLICVGIVKTTDMLYTKYWFKQNNQQVFWREKHIGRFRVTLMYTREIMNRDINNNL